MDDWRPIPHTNYEISHAGYVRHAASLHIQIPTLSKIGVPFVTMAVLPTHPRRPKTEKHHKTFLVSKLMAELWMSPRPPGLMICHEDGDKRHNALSNLSWRDQSYIMKLGYALGIRHAIALDQKPQLSYGDHEYIRALHDGGLNQCQIARLVGITNGGVSKIVRRLTIPRIPSSERLFTANKNR